MDTQTYHPSEELRPYIRRLYVFHAEFPDDFVLEDFVLSETAFVRVLLEGNWASETAPDEWSQPGRVLFSGANEIPLKARVKGGFSVAGFAIRPSGWTALFKESHADLHEKVIPLRHLWDELADDMLRDVETAKDDTGKVAAMEKAISRRVELIGCPDPDQEMAKFEAIARTDSAIKVEDAARQIGLSVRQFERRCKKTFGLGPKAVLRRSRFLDMAAAIRGFSSQSDADLAALRFFDQSHLAREFKRFVRMTPTEFEKTFTPLQTAGLQLRESVRYED